MKEKSQVLAKEFPSEEDRDGTYGPSWLTLPADPRQCGSGGMPG